jgi:hypothetical protein
MQIIDREDQQLCWEGAIDVVHTREWSQAWRIPFADRSLFHPELAVRAAMPAGVRLQFRSDTRTLHLAYQTEGEEVKPLDVVIDGKLYASVPVAQQEEVTLRDLPAGEKRFALWLPQFGQFRLRTLGLDDGASFEHGLEILKDNWMTYGSSITQCKAADSPTRTWPAIVAQRCQYNLTCLGYGGQCHLDPLVAQFMRDRDADFISLCVGINIHGGSLGPRTFGPGIIGFIRILREKHVQTPIAVISPICSPPRETKPGATGLTLQAMRDEVRKAVEILRGHGDKNVHYVDGLQLFGPDAVHMLPDELHPDTAGYAHLAENFIKHVAKPLFRRPALW